MKTLSIVALSSMLLTSNFNAIYFETESISAVETLDILNDLLNDDSELMFNVSIENNECFITAAE